MMQPFEDGWDGTVTLTLSALTIYPVKSCRGIPVNEAQLGPRGLEWDREWMVVDGNGRFVTQRELPRLAWIETSLTSDALVLRHPGTSDLKVPLGEQGGREREVTVWRDTCRAWDMGDEATAWFAQLYGRPLHLVRFCADQHRPCDPAWVGAVPSEAAFADAFPVLVVSEESLADLNQRIQGASTSVAAGVPPAVERGVSPPGIPGSRPVSTSIPNRDLPMERFRPNLVVRGGPPYVEDAARVMRVGGVELHLVKPCVRCRITTTDQATAAVGVEPLRTLATYRRDEALGGVVFGQNAIIASGQGEVLRVGMPVEASTD
jgi:uncharacterized protein YcbX